MNMTPRIALFRGTGMVSWLIKKQSRSEYSHAALVSPYDFREIVEAREFAGVQTRTLTEGDLRYVDFYALPDMSHDVYLKVWEAALREIGKPYDYWSVLRFVSKRPARENGKWFCSEFVHKLLADGGLRLLHRIPSAEVAPGFLSYSPRTQQVQPLR